MSRTQKQSASTSALTNDVCFYYRYKNAVEESAYFAFASLCLKQLIGYNFTCV